MLVSPVGAQTISESPDPVAPGAALTATWSGVSSPTTTDWIELVPAASDDQHYVDWDYDSSCTKTAGSTALASGSCSITVPAGAAPGVYQLRLLAANGYTHLAVSVNFVVSAGAGSLSESPNPVPTGSSATGTFSGVSPATVKDWIGIFPAAGDDHSYLTWVYTSSCTQTPGASALASGSCNLSTAGTTSGASYQLRLFANDGFIRIAVTGNFTVGSGGGIAFIGRTQSNCDSTGHCNAQGLSVNVATPSGVTSGDFVRVAICSYNSIPSLPAGWNVIDSFSNSTQDHMIEAWKLYSPGDGTSYTFGSSNWPKAIVKVFRGAQSIDDHKTASAASSTSLAIPALANTTAAGEVYDAEYCSDDGTTAITGPPDLTGNPISDQVQWASFDGHYTLGAAGSAVPAESAHQ